MHAVMMMVVTLASRDGFELVVGQIFTRLTVQKCAHFASIDIVTLGLGESHDGTNTRSTAGQFVTQIGIAREVANETVNILFAHRALLGP